MKKLIPFLLIVFGTSNYLFPHRTQNSSKERYLSTYPLRSDGVRSLLGENPTTLLYDLAYIYSTSSLVLGNSFTYDKNPTIPQIFTCLAVGYAVTAFSTLCHELGHVAAANLLEDNSSTIFLGNSPQASPLLTIGNRKIVICGLNPCRGATSVQNLRNDHRFNFNRLGVNLAGGAASLLAALAIKSTVYLYHNSYSFKKQPSKILKKAFSHALSLDPITTTGLFCMFSPFPADNDGAYWKTFFFGPK